MSDPGLPAGAGSDPDAPWNEREHFTACLAHEDQAESYECGGHGEHMCGDIDRAINGCETLIGECTCKEIEKNEAAGRADDINDARRDRESDPI